MKSDRSSNFANIKSKEIMKIILSNLEMNKVLKLIRYNKNLQKRLDITKKVFQTLSEPIRIEYQKNVNITRKLYISKRRGRPIYFTNESCALAGNSCCYSIYFIYLLIYVILLVALDGFNEINTQDNSQDSINIINTINKCIFVLVGISIASYIFITFYACKITEDDVDCKRNLKLFMMMLFIIIHLTFEALIIWKLAISYKIKTISVTWFMRMDYVFIVFNFLFIALSVFEFVIYYLDTIPTIIDNTKIILSNLSDINIENYVLPNNFDVLGKREKKNYILQNIEEIKLKNNSNVICSLINTERQKLSISHIKDDYSHKVREFMFLVPSEAFFFNYKYIFRIDDVTYLIKSTLSNFMSKIKNGDKELLKIILNDKLTNCSIMEKINEKDIKYIYLWGDRQKKFLRSGFQGEDELSDLEKLLRKYNIKKNTKQKNKEDGNKIIVELEDKLEENLIDK